MNKEILAECKTFQRIKLYKYAQIWSILNQIMKIKTFQLNRANIKRLKRMIEKCPTMLT